MSDTETFEAGVQLENGEAVFIGEDKKVYPVVARTQKFVKKPVVVEAVQFIPDNERRFSIPAGVMLWPKGGDPEDGSWGYIETLEGRMHVKAFDWIVTGIKGERYPVKPDIFEQSYETL